MCWMTTYAILIKGALSHLLQDVPCRTLECQLDVQPRLGACFYEEKTLLLCPYLRFLSWHLTLPFSRLRWHI